MSSSLIILVHGLWMSGFELGVLKHRLEADGRFRAVPFSYPSLRGSMADHVRSLIDFARTQKADELHFVGHSLGGLVVLKALQVTDDLPPGRAVLMGTPLQGSKAAQGVARMVPFGKAILGHAVNEEIVECQPREWSGRREIGVIAGSMGMGLGRLFAQLQADHDGTVLVEETRLPGSKDHVVLSTSHTGMLFSAEVARQAERFLLDGQFDKSS
ncbi:MAG TPA: alpha/beta fold hydrolase [Povalibacter sp.]|uniref:alpha/beta fold hydrolase n=1 Tax=Povalibacter sp. TaxID=1962978 RepID=UPI002BA493DC|nr:alpha/beta fold hydrolase [Povalibacter sp.]HMN46806.1 alpha/beta fold hydrolase [Povalibacter sp.]